MDCSPSGSFVHGVSQARILEWVAISFSKSFHQFSSVQLLSHSRLFATPWTAALQVSLSITNSQSLLKLMPIESMMPSNHLILCRPLLLLPSIFPSIRIFSNEFFKSVGQSIGLSASASALPNNIQDWFPLGLIGLIFLHSKGLSQFKSRAQPSLWSNFHIPTWLLENPKLWLHGRLSAKWYLCFLICCLGLSWLSFQGANDFKFHGCSHCLQWFWSPRK